MVPRIRFFPSVRFGRLIPKVGSILYKKVSHERMRKVVRFTIRVLLYTIPVVISTIVFGYVELPLGRKWTNIVIWDGIALAAGAFVFCFIDRWRFYSMSNAAQKLMRLRQNDDNQLAAPHWREYPVEEETRAKIDAARRNQEEFLLAPIDMSGRALCAYGLLPFVPSVSADGFSPRDRYNIDIVLHGDAVLLRKNYRGDRKQCVREWFNLEQMYRNARVPIVRKIDVANAVLYMDYIYGRTLLEILRDHGALMRDSDIEHDPSFVGLSSEERQRKLDARGQAVLASVFPEEFLRMVDLLIEDIHRCRVSDLDIRFANIIRSECGTPWMIDFHDARRYPDWAEFLFRFKRDGDILNYTRIFGRPLPRRGHATSRNMEVSETRSGNDFHPANPLDGNGATMRLGKKAGE